MKGREDGEIHCERQRGTERWVKRDRKIKTDGYRETERYRDH